MSSIFPGSASVGQIFEGYLFNGTAWDLIGNEFNPTTFSPDAPDNPKAGDLWVDSDSNVPSISNETILTIDSASATYLDKVSASTTYATKSELANVDLSEYLTESSASTIYATKTELDNIDLSSASAAAVSAIVDSAPATLDTLNELAAALGDDENFASTVATSLGEKAPIESPTFTGTVVVPTLDLTNPLSPEDGGTGLNSLGSAGYVLKVNPGADALEWGSIAGAVYQSTAPVSPQVGDVWVDSDASASVINTNDFLLKADVPTTPVYNMNSGTTAERPTGAEGLFRFNTTTGYPEWYDTSSSSWLNFYQPKPSVEYLVIAGGGGGGYQQGGGGGAGGYLSGTTIISTGILYSCSIGGGGAAATTGGTNALNGGSSFFSTFTTLGGGGGRSISGATATQGGSGGGGAAGLSSQQAGLGTSPQGNDGGNGRSSSPSGGGGGGGAGAAGNSKASNGNGGAGLSSSITGTAVTRAGGGGGGAYTNDSSSGAGGSGGGGAGGANLAAATAGTPNTGGGGGGSSQNAGNIFAAAAGGSGVVILSYPSSYTVAIGAGLTGTTATVGTNKVTTLTAGTGTVSWA